jgi:dihydroflavonol-4-reductase
MKVLVTGATGFIGSHVVRELIAAGHTVRILARPSSDVASIAPGVEIARGELDQPGEACTGVDGLVHLAGISGTLLSHGDPGRELRKVNVDGTRSLFQAARRAGVGRGVLVTSMWTVLRPELAAHSPYVRSRIDSEQAAVAAGCAAMRTVILCPTFVVGKGDRGPNFPGAIVRALQRGRLPVIPPGGSTWIGATDSARSIVAALRSGEHGRRYLLGAEYISHRDLASAIAEMTGRRPPRWTAPGSFVRFAARGADAALAALRKRAPIPLRAGADMLCQPTPVDCTPAWAAFGKPEMRVLDAVAEAVAWFNEIELR